MLVAERGEGGRAATPFLSIVFCLLARFRAVGVSGKPCLVPRGPVGVTLPVERRLDRTGVDCWLWIVLRRGFVGVRGQLSMTTVRYVFYHE